MSTTLSDTLMVSDVDIPAPGASCAIAVGKWFHTYNISCHTFGDSICDVLCAACCLHAWFSMPWVLKVLCTGAGEVQTLGGNVQTLEDEANADVADTLIDDALGELSTS